MNKIHLTCFRNGEMRSGQPLVIEGQMTLDEVKLRVAQILQVPHLSTDNKPMSAHDWVREATLYHSPPPSNGQWAAPQPVAEFSNLYDQDTVVLAVRELLKLPSNNPSGGSVMQTVMVQHVNHVSHVTHPGMMPFPHIPGMPNGALVPPGVIPLPSGVPPHTPPAVLVAGGDENELYRKKKRLTDDHGKPIKLKDANKKRRLNPRCSTITACIEQVRKFRADCKLKNKSLTNLNSTYVIHARFEKAEQLQPGWSHSADERKLGSADAHEEAKQIISNKTAGGGPQRWPTRAGRTANSKAGKDGRGTPAQQQQQQQQQQQAAAAAQQQAAMAAQHAAAMQAQQAAHQHMGFPQGDPLLGQGMINAQMNGMAIPRPRNHASDDNGALSPVHPVIWRDKDLCNLHATRSLDTLTLHHLKKIMEAVRLAPPKGAKVDFVNKLASYLANCICCRHQPPYGVPNQLRAPTGPAPSGVPGFQYAPAPFNVGVHPGGRPGMPGVPNGMPNLPPNMSQMAMSQQMAMHQHNLSMPPNMVGAAVAAASAAGQQQPPHGMAPSLGGPKPGGLQALPNIQNMAQNMPPNIPNGMSLHPVLGQFPGGAPPQIVGGGRPMNPIAMQAPMTGMSNGIPNIPNMAPLGNPNGLPIMQQQQQQPRPIQQLSSPPAPVAIAPTDAPK